MREYPFPIPFGWYQVGVPADVKPGEVKPLFYWGRHLVLWRDEDGTAHVQDAFCPHLGAHIGHGGHVDADRLVCPFHGWEFDADGQNVGIPYSDRINKSACIRTYEVIERNGIVMAWYHPHDEEPKWEIPVVPQLEGDDEWTEMVTRDFVIHAALQELAENGVDSAHFRFVHSTDIVPELEGYETDGYISRMRSSQKFPTPQGVVDGRIDVDTYGPGFGLVRFSGIVDTVNLGCNTPIDERTCHLRFNFTVRKLGDDAATSTVGDAFVREVTNQVIEDIPIWENKAFIPRPALADTDGPFMKFRKWAAQFYAEPVAQGDEPWVPAAPDPTKPIEVVEMGKTAAAKHRAD